MSPDHDAVDPALLAAAARVLGTSTPLDTLERALTLAIQRANRDQAVAAEIARFASGRYDALSGSRRSAQSPAAPERIPS